MDPKDIELLELIFESVEIENLRTKDPTITEERLKGLLDSLRGELGCDGAEQVILYIDGAARGNPGKAGIGIVLRDKRERVLEEVGQYIGETTNNVAEYRALLEGLKRAVARGARRVEIFSDSELLVKQVHGEYRVKARCLLPLYTEAMELLGSLSQWKITHISREKNSRADALANMAIDTQEFQSKT